MQLKIIIGIKCILMTSLYGGGLLGNWGKQIIDVNLTSENKSKA
jgi:hypothetical protein